MDFVTPESLLVSGGAALAVTLIVAGLKSAFGITGRRTQTVAFVVSMLFGTAIGIYTGGFSTLLGGLATLTNAFVIYMAAIGADQIANYGK
jgi:hypothetical protein